MKQKYNGLRHGENVLYPIEGVAKGKRKSQKIFIVGHSETGHHHVLESEKDFDILIKDDLLYLELFEPAKLVHKKQTEKHKTLIVNPGKYVVKRKTEYDPWQQLMRNVFD